MFDELGPGVPLVYQSVQLACAHLHDREFASYEKAIETDQRRDDRQFRKQDQRRIPMPHDGFSQQRHAETEKYGGVHCPDAIVAPETLTRLAYQLDFVTPGMSPEEANSRKVSRETLKRRIKARRRPVT